MVYFLLFGRVRLIKIGFTSREKRFTELAREMGEAPKVLALVHGDRSDESRFLRMFPRDRIHPRGEWFRMSADIIYAARNLPNQIKAKEIRVRDRHVKSPIRIIRYENANHDKASSL